MGKGNIFLMIICLFIASSCVKDIDFDQAENLELTPTLVAAIVNTNIKQTDIIDPSGFENTEFNDVSRFDVFTTDFFEKVEKMVIDFEITNPFDRGFTISLTFFDDAGGITYQLPLISVPENVTGFQFSHEILIENSPLLNSKNLETTVRLLPSSNGSIINVNENKAFNFTSAGTFYLKID